MYRILFIDEEKESFEYFEEFVENSTTKDNIQVITQLPLQGLEEMVEHIFKLNPDAIITDFMLNEKREDIDYNVPYNGVELVERFLEFRDNFPCFVLTSFDDLAIGESEDVNKIYIKNILHNTEKSKAKATFLDRVISQIEHYKSTIQNAEIELKDLIQLRKSGEAKISDEKRIIELDHFLEQSINKQSSIPIEYKSLSNTDRLSEILNKVDELIHKVDNKDGK